MQILQTGKPNLSVLSFQTLIYITILKMLNQILKTYDTYGYKFLVFTGDDHKSTEREYIQELLSYKIEGMVIFKPYHSFQRARLLQSPNCNDRA